MMNVVKILGVTVDAVSREECDTYIERVLTEEVCRTIVTPNPEIVLQAYRNVAVANAINNADLRLPDGFGLRFCSSLHHTVHGADIAEDILLRAGQAGLRIGCVVRADGRSSAQDVEKAIRTRAPHSAVYICSLQKSRWRDNDVAEALRHFQPDIIFVGVGSPEQELWVDAYARTVPMTKIAMAVGGTFDFWSGVARRAPRMVRSIHMEWLWRLACEPHRFQRIINAVVIFPLIVLRSSISKSHSSK